MNNEQISIEQIRDEYVEMLYFTDNNSLRAYLSKDAIVCNEIVGTDNFERSFGNILGSGLLITNKPLDRETIFLQADEYRNTFPVILRLFIKKGSDCNVPSFIISSDYTIRKGHLNDYDYGKDIAAFIVGQIPFSLVKEIIFESEDNALSIQQPLHNIHYPAQQFKVEPELFSGNFNIDINRITTAIDESFENNSNLQALLRISIIRDKIKSIYLCGASNIDTQIKTYSINFDEVVLNLAGEKLDQIVQEISKSNIPIQKEDIQEKSDPTPYFRIDDILAFIIGDLSEDDWIKLLRKESKQNQAEILGYQIAMKKFFDLKESIELDKSSWLAEYKEEFISQLKKIKIGKRIIDSYEAEINAVLEIFEGIGRVSDIINRNREKGLFLVNTLLLLLKNWSAKEEDNLHKELGHFGFNQFEARMTLCLYASLHGVAILNRAYKSSPLVNRMSDLVAYTMTADEDLISDIIDFKEFNVNRDKSEYSTIVTPKGLPLSIKENINADICARFILDYFKNTALEKEDKENFLQKLQAEIIIPAGYYNFVTTIESDNFATKYSSGIFVIKSSVEPKIERVVNLEKYLNQVVSDNSYFKQEYNKQKDKWDALLREKVG